MPRTFADLHKSVILAVDVQPKFMSGVYDSERVLKRIEFLVESASILGGTIIATEQNRERMGGSAESILPFLSEPPADKMTFSCSGCDLFRRHLGSSTPIQVVLVGIETHICVSQTTHELLDLGHEVIICADAVSSRTQDRHEIGLERLRSAGAVIAHSESVVYEWLRSAEHDKFREVLAVVKAFQ